MESNTQRPLTVLIAPLDWGLGHATRCIPLIKNLIKLQCNIVIATEGQHHELLKVEFPSLNFVLLPGYRISYTNSKRFFVLKIICQIPKILKAIRRENKWLQQYVAAHQVDLIISDNRYGFYHPGATSVFITHQLNIRAGAAFVENILRRINYRFINRFSECWVPDAAGVPNLAGTLSHPPTLPKVPVKYLGPVSRFSAVQVMSVEYRLLIILSGPEPQRTALENLMLHQLREFKEKVILVRGLPGSKTTLQLPENITVCNHLPADQLQQVFEQCALVICRSGYTTVMDLCMLRKKSIMVPTPGQTEQEYLAIHLQEQGICIAAKQDTFHLRTLLQQAETFDFCFPEFEAQVYEKVVSDLINRQYAPLL